MQFQSLLNRGVNGVIVFFQKAELIDETNKRVLTAMFEQRNEEIIKARRIEPRLANEWFGIANKILQIET